MLNFETNVPRRHLVCSMLLGVISGCAGPPKPIFEPHAEVIVWPAPPQVARIRYIGELHADEDLKPKKRAVEVLSSVLGGRRPIQPLYGPRSVVCTPDGNRLWIADPGGRCLHLFDLQNRSYKKINRCGSGHLLTPVGLCLGPPGAIYVCDSEQVAVHRYSDIDGQWIGSLTLPDDLLRPVALHYDASSDELFVVDTTSHDVKVLDSAGSLKRTIGKRGSGPGEFNFPSAIAADKERLWIADTGNHRVQALTLAGEPVAAFGQAGDAPGDLEMPKSIAVDPDDHVYVVDGRFENVQIFDADGSLLLFFGQEGTKAGEFWLPGGIFIEPSGRIWVCDTYNRRVQLFQYLRESDDGS